MAHRKSFRSFTKGIFRDIDVPLFAAVAAISLFGIINMYGIIGAGPLLIKHIIFVLVGLGLMVFLSFVNYRYFKNYSSPVLFLYFL